MPVWVVAFVVLDWMFLKRK